MIEIGTLVRNHRSMGIVIDHWVYDTTGEYHAVVKWITGRHVGVSYRLYNNFLEIVA